jgi:hypothetical protein
MFERNMLVASASAAPVTPQAGTSDAGRAAFVAAPTPPSGELTFMPRHDQDRAPKARRHVDELSDEEESEGPRSRRELGSEEP